MCPGYILPIGSLYATYLLFPEPEKSVEQIPSLKLTARPENGPGPKRKRESLPTIHFHVRVLLVSGRATTAHF